MKMNVSNVKIQKILKASKTAGSIVKFAKIFLIVMSVVTIVCGCGFIGTKNYLDQRLAQALAEGEVTADELFVNVGGFLEGALNLAKVDSVSLTLGVYMIVMGIVLIGFSIIMHFLAKVFTDIRESYSPFRPEIVKSLKVVFVLTTLFALRSSLLMGVIIGFSMWCVLHIFEYGCELQRQSDETL